jgi:hypothetical protein
LKRTSDRDLNEPDHQPWRRTYGPFKNSRIVDWGIFFASIVFSAMALIFGGLATYSVSSFDPKILISAFGIAIFYILGEWWRRRPADKQTVTSARRSVLLVLFAGLVIFVFGLYFIYNPFLPSSYIFTLASYAIVSSIVGLAAGYVLVKVRQNKDEITI